MVFYQRNFWTALYKYFLLLIGYAGLGIVFLLVVIFASLLMF